MEGRSGTACEGDAAPAGGGCRVADAQRDLGYANRVVRRAHVPGGEHEVGNVVGAVEAGAVPALREGDLGDEARAGIAGRHCGDTGAEHRLGTTRRAAPCRGLIGATGDRHEACGECGDIGAATLVAHASGDRRDPGAVLVKGGDPVGREVVGVIAGR